MCEWDGILQKEETMRNQICIAIKTRETGCRIRNLMKARGYSVRDIQEMMGFENPRAVYKWLSGDTLPSLDNFLILSKILNTNMEDILVYDGDAFFMLKRYMIFENDIFKLLKRYKIR